MVVVFHEGVQCTLTLVLARQRVEVQAFAHDGLEPALDLPVRLWPVRPGPAGTHAQVRARRLPCSGDVLAPVVREHPLHWDPEPTEVRIHPAQEPGGRLPALVGEQFHVRHARRVIDGGVDHRPSRPAGARPAIAGHPVSRPADDASEFLGVDVDQVAWPRPLVAGGGRGRHPGPAETQAHDRPVDGGAGQSQHEGDPVGTPAPFDPVDGDRLLLRRGERHPGAPGPAGPVRQPGQALTREPLPPVVVRRPRDAGIGARIGHRCPRRDRVQQPCAPVRGQSGVRVIVLHPKASLAGVVSTTSTVPGEAFIPFPPAPVNNVVRDDS